MKVRNKRIYSADQEYLATIRAEYIMIGFDTALEEGCLTIFSRRKKKPKEKREKSERNKRAESHARD